MVFTPTSMPTELKINTMFRIIVLFAIAVLKVNDAAVATLPPVENPPEFIDQKGCYVPTLKRVLEYNRTYSASDSCAQYTCQITNETYINTCGKVAVSHNCRIIKGKNALPFNKCCDTVLCGAANSVLHG